MGNKKRRQSKIFLNLIKKKDRPLFSVVPDHDTIVNMTKKWIKENFEDIHFIYQKYKKSQIEPIENI